MKNVVRRGYAAGCLWVTLSLCALVPVALGEQQLPFTAYFDRGEGRTFTVFVKEPGVYPVEYDGDLLVNGQPGNKGEAVLNHGTNTITLLHGQNINALYLQGADGFSKSGATVPYVTYEAENLPHQGEVLAGDRDYRTFTSEAQGRALVKMEKAQDYVEVILAEEANALVVRFAVAEGEKGAISVSTGEGKIASLPVTSYHTWVYGKFPWTNNPADGLGHVFFDDVWVMLDRVYPRGTVIRLSKEGDLSYLMVDFVEAEYVSPPLAQNKNSLSILDFGAIPDDEIDDSSALNKCIAQAAKEGKEVYMPKGTFLISNPVLVNGIWLNKKGTMIRGAGMWHTTLAGPYAYFTFKASNIGLYDFALRGRADLRRDTYATAIESDFNRFDIKNIDVHNLWIEHYNIGIWVNCINSMHITGCRIRNTYADGINLRRGCKNTVVEQCAIRNTGDDGIAQWSAAVANTNNKVRFNTVALPWLANNIAVYGGVDIEITDNLLTDTIAFGGGVNISSKFDPQPFGGTILVARNTFLRTGSRDWDINRDYGAVWVNTVTDHPNHAKVIIADNTILDSTYHSIAFTGDAEISDIAIQNNFIDKDISLDRETAGTLTLTGNTGHNELVNLAGENFHIQ